VRGTNREWSEGPFAHELTHIVIADRFDLEQLPRWADEGMATFADSEEKQKRHGRDLQSALRSGKVIRLGQLLPMTEYPRGEQWGAFYGESLSLVKFLVERDSPKVFTEFLTTARSSGFDEALRKVYRIAGVAGLEREWTRSAELGASTQVVRASR
jgi:hypothetical protein